MPEVMTFAPIRNHWIECHSHLLHILFSEIKCFLIMFKPVFIMYKDGDHQKIVVETIHPSKKYTMYFDDEEIEDFYFFIEQVYKETA